MKLVFLNVKSQRADDWENIESLGLSIAATHTEIIDQKKHIEQAFYEEKDVDKLLKELLSSDLVITFNGHAFDFRVLNAYSADNLFEKTKSFHILENIEGGLWERLSLANLAKQNLDKFHTTDIFHQSQLYQRNLMRQLRNTVEYDIDSIVKLFYLGCQRKFLNYWCPDIWTQKSFRTDSWADDCRKLTKRKRNKLVDKNYRRW